MKHRILIVEDNPYILKLTSDLLQRVGYHVTALSSGEDLLRVVRGLAPHLILMDVQLPGLDGYTLTRQLKSQPDTRDAVILAFTAFAMKKDEETALAAGCDGYVSKPVQVETLLHTVDSFLNRSRQPVPAAAARSAPAPATPPPSGSDRPTILVVDDNGTMLKLLATVLTAAGFRVVEALDGPEALNRMAESRPDLVITDVTMPGMSGYELCRAIKEAPATGAVPVLLLTGGGDPPPGSEEARLCAGHIVEKPFRQADLLARIRTLLGQP